MTKTCLACKQPITVARYFKCTICEAHYHIICVKSARTQKPTADWRCDSCRKDTLRAENEEVTATLATNSIGCTPGNEGTPRPSKRAALGSPQLIADNDSPTNDVVLSNKNIIAELRLLRSEINEQNSGITERLDKCLERMDSFDKRITAVENKVASIPTLQATIMQLQEQLAQQTQNGMKNEIEILGIDESSSENLSHIAMVIATKIGVNLQDTDIDWVTRAGPKPRSNLHSQQLAASNNPPRPVIMRLTRRSKRDELLKSAKTRRSLASADINIPGPNRKIYVNEHLTKQNRLLFRDARGRAKESGFRFCWVNNGRIFARRAEGSPAISIGCPADLDKIFKLTSS